MPVMFLRSQNAVHARGAQAYSLYCLLKLWKLLEIKLNFLKWSIVYLFHVVMGKSLANLSFTLNPRLWKWILTYEPMLKWIENNSCHILSTDAIFITTKIYPQCLSVLEWRIAWRQRKIEIAIYMKTTLACFVFHADWHFSSRWNN